jgi:hypothetical protein
LLEPVVAVDRVEFGEGDGLFGFGVDQGEGGDGFEAVEAGEPFVFACAFEVHGHGAFGGVGDDGSEAGVEAWSVVFADEDGVVADHGGADESVSLLDGERGEGGERGAEVEAVGLGLAADELRVVGDGDGVDVSEGGVEFADDDDGLDDVDSLPDPVVVAVDVDAEEADLADEVGFGEELVDVVGIDEGGPGHEVVAVVARLPDGEVGESGVAVDDESAPVAVLEEEAGVGFGVVAYTELDEGVEAGWDGETLDEPVDDAILAPLGEDFEFGVLKGLDGLQGTDVPAGYAALKQHGVVELIGNGAGDESSYVANQLGFDGAEIHGYRFIPEGITI